MGPGGLLPFMCIGLSGIPIWLMRERGGIPPMLGGRGEVWKGWPTPE